jgi:hypothetical protein
VLTFLRELIAFMYEDRIVLTAERRAMFISNDQREKR